jgi:peptidoglycan/LPS O-acetylase OafA/YrhL
MTFKQKLLDFTPLSICYDDKNNHLNLIKFLLSLFVLHTHCYLFLQGSMINDPLKKIFYIKWGDLGTTTLFYLISGFVLAQSIIRNKNILQFVWNRLVKIYPAVILANLVFIFIGYYVSDIGFKTYYFGPELRHFLFKNSILINDIKQRLGLGVFESNPLPFILNAQWWTLKWTFLTYFFAFLIFYPIKLINRKIYFNLFYISSLVFFNYLKHDTTTWMGIIFSFFLTGIFFYLNKEKIPINYFIAMLSIIIYILIYNTRMILFFSPLLKGYLLFFIATKSNKFLLKFNSIRDLSFGIFLYHVFFIQFLIFVGFTNIYPLFFITLIISIMFAYFSNLSTDWIKFKTYKILKPLI